MKVIVGSAKDAKIAAVRKQLVLYEMFTDVQVEGIETASGVSDQPMTLEETLTGATNRARAAYGTGEYKYAFGVEDGIQKIDIPGLGTFFVNFSSCVIFDGVKCYPPGISSGFCYPQVVMDEVHGQRVDTRQAFVNLGLVTDAQTFNEQGAAVGLLSGGRLPREDYAREAIRSALFYLVKEGPVHEQLAGLAVSSD